MYNMNLKYDVPPPPFFFVMQLREPNQSGRGNCGTLVFQGSIRSLISSAVFLFTSLVQDHGVAVKHGL
jgi:hypothetical protein